MTAYWDGYKLDEAYLEYYAPASEDPPPGWVEVVVELVESCCCCDGTGEQEDSFGGAFDCECCDGSGLERHGSDVLIEAAYFESVREFLRGRDLIYQHYGRWTETINDFWLGEGGRHARGQSIGHQIAQSALGWLGRLSVLAGVR